MENNAGLFRRIMAVFLDWLLVMVVYISPAYVLFQIDGNLGTFFGILLIYALALISLAALMIIYQAYFISHFGATVGKMLFGLKVVDQDNEQNIDFKTAFLRVVVGYAFSTQFFGIGFWRIIKHPEKLGWHDELFNTKVVKTKGPVLGIISFVIAVILLGFLSATVISDIMTLVMGTKASPGLFPELMPDQVLVPFEPSK